MYLYVQNSPEISFLFIHLNESVHSDQKTKYDSQYPLLSKNRLSLFTDLLNQSSDNLMWIHSDKKLFVSLFTVFTLLFK